MTALRVVASGDSGRARRGAVEAAAGSISVRLRLVRDRLGRRRHSRAQPRFLGARGPCGLEPTLQANASSWRSLGLRPPARPRRAEEINKKDQAARIAAVVDVKDRARYECAAGHGIERSTLGFALMLPHTRSPRNLTYERTGVKAISGKLGFLGKPFTVSNVKRAFLGKPLTALSVKRSFLGERRQRSYCKTFLSS